MVVNVGPPVTVPGGTTEEPDTPAFDRLRFFMTVF